MKKQNCPCCGTSYDPEKVQDHEHLSVFGSHFHGCPNCGALKIKPDLPILTKEKDPLLLECICRGPKNKKHFQKAELPVDAVFSVSTPILTDTTVPSRILSKHMTPKGKCGLLTVLKGDLQLVWEDTGVIHDADPQHPVLLYPERYHHIQMNGPSEFRIDFYEIKYTGPADESAVRPGEDMIRSNS